MSESSENVQELQRELFEWAKASPLVEEITSIRWNYALNYFDISRRALLELVRTRTALENNQRALDQVADPDEESTLWEQRDQLHIQQDQATVTTIVFATMCLEATINDFGSRCTSQSYFSKHLDGLSIESKWLLIPQVVTARSLDTDSQTYELLVTLFRARNNLVHFKPKTLPLGKQEVWDKHFERLGRMMDTALHTAKTVLAATDFLRGCHQEYAKALETFKADRYPELHELL